MSLREAETHWFWEFLGISKGDVQSSKYDSSHCNYTLAVKNTALENAASEVGLVLYSEIKRY